jgi:hypothetical protein
VGRISAALLLGGGAVLAAARGPLARRHMTSQAPTAELLQTPRVSAPSSESPSRAADPATIVPPTPLTDMSEPPAVIERAAAPSNSHRASTADTLAEEEAILEEARRTMGTSPHRALRLLDVHQRRFPAGELTAERLFLRVDGLKRLGKMGDARREADSLIKRFPTSTYARLVDDSLGSAAAHQP